MNLAGHARWRESVISTAFSIPKQRPRTVVIGAGVIGLGIAWRLAQAGCAVTVYDRGEAGRGASWAAAGLLPGAGRSGAGRGHAGGGGGEGARGGAAPAADPRKPAPVARFRA